MSRPPRARELVLDAFEEILVSEGERAATLDATARTAGVSKGGLLYHFGSKDDLEAGLVGRLRERVAADIVTMTSAPDGPVSYYLRSSVTDGGELDRAIVAVSRLAQGGSTAAATALREVRQNWEDAVRPHLRDQAAVDLVMLVGDGLYYNSVLDGGGLPGPTPSGGDLDALVDLVLRATRPGT